eukprot:7390131-Prymnesium_polylepis.1
MRTCSANCRPACPSRSPPRKWRWGARCGLSPRALPPFCYPLPPRSNCPTPLPPALASAPSSGPRWASPAAGPTRRRSRNPRRVPTRVGQRRHGFSLRRATARASWTGRALQPAPRWAPARAARTG